MNEIDWKNLSFGYMKTDYNVRIYYRDGKIVAGMERFVSSVLRRMRLVCNLPVMAFLCPSCLQRLLSRRSRKW